MPFIRKDGARIYVDTTDNDLIKKYSEFAGTKLVNEKFSSISLSSQVAPASVNTVYVNPCESKILQCYGILSDAEITAGFLDIYASGGLLVRHDFTQNPVDAGVPLSMPVYNDAAGDTTVITGNQAVWLTGSGTVSIALTLELHEVYRWTD